MTKVRDFGRFKIRSHMKQMKKMAKEAHKECDENLKLYDDIKYWHLSEADKEEYRSEVAWQTVGWIVTSTAVRNILAYEMKEWGDSLTDKRAEEQLGQSIKNLIAEGIEEIFKHDFT